MKVLFLLVFLSSVTNRGLLNVIGQEILKLNEQETNGGGFMTGENTANTGIRFGNIREERNPFWAGRGRRSTNFNERTSEDTNSNGQGTSTDFGIWNFGNQHEHRRSFPLLFASFITDLTKSRDGINSINRKWINPNFFEQFLRNIQQTQFETGLSSQRRTNFQRRQDPENPFYPTRG